MAKFTYEQLYDLYFIKGLNVHQISKQLKTSTHTLKRDFTELGIPIKPKKSPLQDLISKETLRDLYEIQLKSTGEIGEMFGVHMSSVNYLLKKYGIKPRPAHEAVRGYFDKYPNVNIGFFENMSPQLAFYLGLMYSDGYVDDKSNVGISLTDPELIKWIAKVIDYKPQIRQVTQDNGKILYSLRFSNPKVSELLINRYKLSPRKSKSIEFPNFIPEEYIPYFIRGVFEGDGTVGIYEFRENGKIRKNYIAAIYSGSRAFLEKIKEIIEKFIPGQRKIVDANAVEAYRVCGIRNVCKFGEWLYQGTIFVESRKLQEFMKMGAAIIPVKINIYNNIALINKQLSLIKEELAYLKVKTDQQLAGCNDFKKKQLYKEIGELEEKFIFQLNEITTLLNEVTNK
jgi:hypothetical protein